MVLRENKKGQMTLEEAGKYIYLKKNLGKVKFLIFHCIIQHKRWLKTH